MGRQHLTHTYTHTRDDQTYTYGVCINVLADRGALGHTGEKVTALPGFDEGVRVF